MTTKTININSIYYGMKEAIERRIRLQKKQDELWRTIKRTNRCFLLFFFLFLIIYLYFIIKAIFINDDRYIFFF